jgi:hypothetical protein
LQTPSGGEHFIQLTPRCFNPAPSAGKEALNKSSLSALLENRDDHKARDAGRSWDYDAKERNAMSARFYRNPEGRGFAGGLPCQAPGEGGQPFASSPFAHPIPQSRRRASVDLFSASLRIG